MNWIKQEHFTASASLHGVIILPLTLFVKLFDYLNLVDRPVMFLWSSLLCQVVSHISVSISGLLSCSAYENAPKFRVPQKVISRTNLFCLMSFLFSACYMEWLWSLVNFASNHFMLNLSALPQKMHRQIIFALQLMGWMLLTCYIQSYFFSICYVVKNFLASMYTINV